jgi:hypothetical protein
MHPTERHLRQIIREELTHLDSVLSEAIRDTHGYTVTKKEDVEWSRRGKMGSIPVWDNPFVGFNDAFEDWYNWGSKAVRWSRELKKTPLRPEGGTRRGVKDVYFDPGDHVIIPYLDKMGDLEDLVYTVPGVIMSTTSLNAQAEGVPGADPLDSIPLATIKWSGAATGRDSYTLTNVGFAFLVEVAGPQGRNADEKAADFMEMWREAGGNSAGRGQRREKDPRPRKQSLMAPEPEKRSVLRRPGGVATPGPRPTLGPAPMSADQIRADLNVKRRE